MKYCEEDVREMMAKMEGKSSAWRSNLVGIGIE
jgi:hypothetical protein